MSMESLLISIALCLIFFFHKEHCKTATSMVGDHVSGMCHGISKWVGFSFISFNPFFGNLQPTVQAWKKDLSIYDGLWVGRNWNYL